MLNHPDAKEGNLVRIGKETRYVMQHHSICLRMIIFTTKLKNKKSIMAHHLNTNKQFMVGNGILAFAVIFIVVLFLYISMRMQREKQDETHFAEVYTIQLVKGFTGDSISLIVNDSLVMNKQIADEPTEIEVTRFAEQSALLIVDNRTEEVATFDLSEKGGTYRFEKEADGIKQLAQ